MRDRDWVVQYRVQQRLNRGTGGTSWQGKMYVLEWVVITRGRLSFNIQDILLVFRRPYCFGIPELILIFKYFSSVFLLLFLRLFFDCLDFNRDYSQSHLISVIILAVFCAKWNPCFCKCMLSKTRPVHASSLSLYASAPFVLSWLPFTFWPAGSGRNPCLCILRS